MIAYQCIDWNEPCGDGCFVSNRILKDKYKVGYMYREQPDPEMPDSGWRLLAGNEDNVYSSNQNNFHFVAIDIVCSYDPDIIPFLYAEIGSAFIRINSNTFVFDNKTHQVFVVKQIN